MSLTPSATDPNRKSELARKKKDPDSFGSTPQQLPADWTPTGSVRKDVPPTPSLKK